MLIELIEDEITAHAQSPLVNLFDRLDLTIELVLYLPNHLFDQVFKRDDAGVASVLIQNDGKLEPFTAEAIEHFLQRQGLRDEVRRTHNRPQIPGFGTFLAVAGQVLNMKDTDDLIQI